MKSNYILLGLLLVISLVLGYLGGIIDGKEEGNPVNNTIVVKPVNGDNEAERELVQFVDLKSEPYLNWVESVYPNIEKDFVKTNKVKIKTFDVSFIDSGSELLAKIGFSIYSQKPELYLDYFKVLSENNDKLGFGEKAFTLDLIEKELNGIDIEQIKQDLADDTYEESMILAKGYANKYQITNVPSFYVDGKLVKQPNDYKMFKGYLEGRDMEKEMDEQFLNGQVIIGDKTAKVEIIEFLDYKCGYCGKWYDEFYETLKKDYIDKGVVKLYSVNMAFLGPDSYTAALAEKSVFHHHPSKISNLHRILFENEWSDKESIIRLIEEKMPNVDAEKISNDIENETFKAAIEKDKEYAEMKGVSGTPTIFIDGQRLENAFDYDYIKSFIELNK